MISDFQVESASLGGRAYFASDIQSFLSSNVESVLGSLVSSSQSVEQPQVHAWREQVSILQKALALYQHRGHIFFEFILPRLGRRIDVVLVIDHVLFVLEFKVGEREFTRHAIDQVWDYALDLKNFHEASRIIPIVPVLISTRAYGTEDWSVRSAADGVFQPMCIGAGQIEALLWRFLDCVAGEPIKGEEWAAGRYSPTPTIIEAARALWNGHSVSEISRCDAGSAHLGRTVAYVNDLIETSARHGRKALCILTGVPGAGKTLVGLDIANRRAQTNSALHNVFLSGNGPLVAILREALASDMVSRERTAGRTLAKGHARRQVETFIQNVHHFRDDCLVDVGPPPEHVAVFDEAQRAWNREQTVAFMTRKKGRPDFDTSEPEFLLSCMDRHPDWAVVLCLVGGGQEINTGEAGISGWIDAVRSRFPHWSVHLSPRLEDSEYGSGEALSALRTHSAVCLSDDLHLSVSMRSFRAERVSNWVKHVLDFDMAQARDTLQNLLPRYPIVLTRDLDAAKRWLKSQARGNERFGLVVSSQAQRLKPHAIDVRVPLDPVHWFLAERDDVRSSFYLEDAATEFHVQGLELDWSCVVWDADFRRAGDAWDHWSFVGNRWQRIRKLDRQLFLKNAYRVLLTRARQGMVLVVPNGQGDDPTRDPAFYDATFDYLQSLGLPRLAQESF